MKRSILSLLCVLCFPLFAHAERLRGRKIDVHVYQQLNGEVGVSIVSIVKKEQHFGLSIAKAVKRLGDVSNGFNTVSVNVGFENIALARKALPLCQAVADNGCLYLSSFCVKEREGYLPFDDSFIKAFNREQKFDIFQRKPVSIPKLSKGARRSKPYEYDEINLTGPRTPGPKNLRDIRSIQRTPLFDNAPFLRLRKGDQFLQAERRKISLGKNGDYRPKYYYENSYFLFSEGKTHEIKVHENKGKLHIHSPSQCVLFDWSDVTIANATVIKNLCSNNPVLRKSPFLHHDVSHTNYQTIVKLLTKSFPEMQCFAAKHCVTKNAEIISIDSKKSVAFEGLSYDDTTPHHLYKYRLTIGPSVFRCTKTVLIAGPKNIPRSTFQGHLLNPQSESSLYHDLFKKPVFPIYSKVLPKIAKQKRQEYDEMVTFKLLVAGVIRPQHVPKLKQKFHVPPLKTTEK